MANAREILDVSGKTCPIPLMKAKKVLKIFNSGDILELISTDKQTVNDLEKFCLRGKYNLLNSTNDGSKYTFLIQKN